MSRKLMYSVPLLAIALMVSAAQLFGGGQIHAQTPQQGPNEPASVIAKATDGTYLGQEGYKPSDSAITVWWVPPLTGPRPTHYVISYYGDESDPYAEKLDGGLETATAAEGADGYTITDLFNPNPSGSKYIVTVQSYICALACQEGGLSDEVFVTLHPKSAAPQTDGGEETEEPAPTVVPTGPVQNLSLSATSSTLTASWDVPATGSAPIFYAVVVRNTETNKTFFRRNLRDTDTTFKNKLKSGVTYSVSVQARNHTLKGLQYEGIYNKKGVPKPKYFNDNEMFSRSDWVSGEVTLKGEKQASGDSARLIWIYLHPGEKTPGYAVGEPTQNMKRINGEWVPYSAADCKADIDVHSSDIDVIRQQALVDAANAANENAQAELAKNPGNPMYQKLAEMAQAEVDAATRILGEIVAEKQADAEAACESKYVEDENLTEADFRWVQVPANMVEDKE